MPASSRHRRLRAPSGDSGHQLPQARRRQRRSCRTTPPRFGGTTEARLDPVVALSYSRLNIGLSQERLYKPTRCWVAILSGSIRSAGVFGHHSRTLPERRSVANVLDVGDVTLLRVTEG